MSRGFRYRRGKPFTVPGHRLSYEVVHDPEGNFWTVTCSCGQFTESTGSRAEARNEGYFHKAEAQRRAAVETLAALLDRPDVDAMGEEERAAWERRVIEDA